MKQVNDRREFIKTGLAAGTAALLMPTLLQAQGKNPQKKKLGIALVGLGTYSTYQLAPALQETSHCYLAGIVTGTPEKEKMWADKYNIPQANIYNYDNFDSIANNPDIDIIYIVLPNSMHAEYTIRAAKTGKHVICEKPMALNPEECKAMINACNENNVSLSLGYRMHFEPHNQEVVRYAKEKTFGDIKYVHAAAAFVSTFTKADWRLQKAYGGGVLMDMGIYPILGARYATGEWPVAVTAQEYHLNPDLYDEVDEHITMQLEFPGGIIANLMASFSNNSSQLYVNASKGWCELMPYSYYSGIRMHNSNGPVEFPQVNQQAAHMDDVARSIANNQPVRATGIEGLKDMQIMQAVKKAMTTGKRVTINYL